MTFFSCHPDSDEVISTRFCTWHNICAVMTYANICDDKISGNGITTHQVHWIKIMRKQGKSEGFESCDRPIVRKRPIWVKIGDVLSRVTLKFDGWPWKTIGHLSFAVSSFVQHFIAIGEFKLELHSRNAKSRSKWTIFFSRVTLKFDRWPSKTIGHLFYATSRFVQHFVAIGEFEFELQSGNAQSGSKSTIF